MRNKPNELIIANKELAFQIGERGKRAAELAIASKELTFQNEEKGKRATELIVANKELTFQNEEKQKRAAELIVANKELAFQIEEKEKRAYEFIVINKELAFQIGEKEKRTGELTVVNKELAFQIKEKEERAAELVIAEQELAFQNEEKEKRAAELVIANEELAFQIEEREKRAEELITANKNLGFQNAAYEELKIVEKQLNEVNKELEAFSYSVSHDLRAPLRAIIGFSTMLQEDYETKLDAEGNRIIKVIIDNTAMMGKLIDDLLTFSRLSRVEAVPEFTDMKKLAETGFAELLQSEKQTNYTIAIEAMPQCRGDESMLKQVWSNLINNALKYSSKVSSPKIEAGAISNDKTNTYYVRDNGAGFDMKYSDKLFGVFQRLHRQDEFKGTGLGLALVKRIVAKHGGEIWAESKLNEGATFYFTIPKTI